MMYGQSISSEAVEILTDPEVKSYFLTILASDELSPGQKYKEIVDFFAREHNIRQRMLRYAGQMPFSQEGDLNLILAQVSKDLESWNPDEDLRRAQKSIQHAVRRLRDSQHEDGGWGFEFQKSDCWATVHSVLCLAAAAQLEEFSYGFSLAPILHEGIQWLDQHQWDWAIHRYPVDQKIFVYEFSLVSRCFYELGESYFPGSFANAIAQGLVRLMEYQNEDGGWEEARNRNPEDPQERTGRDSEVGATSFAVRAFARAQGDYAAQIEKGVLWLLGTQAPGGYWHYHDFRTGRGIPSITKTCDGIQGILVCAGSPLPSISLKQERIQAQIFKAVDWLQSQEKPILEAGHIGGWGWMTDDAASFDLENTCLTLETLVRMPNPSLPLLTNSANWLLKKQYQEGDPWVAEDKDIGKWQYELTARITLSLIEYYKKLKEVTAALTPGP